MRLKHIILPGLVFQSVVIAGGYGTGREIVEFFLRYGPWRGLLGMVLISTVIWSAVNAASYEFARTFRVYDYRSFFRELLGPAWWLFEVAYFAMLAIVLAVIAAAAGTMWQEVFGVPYVVGVLAITGAVGFLVWRGSDLIEKVLTGWSIVLYATYAVLFVWAFARFGDAIAPAFRGGEAGAGWILGGVRYAGYNLAVVPAVFFAIRHISSRREAVVAGVIAGPIAMLPGLLFLVAVAGLYPAVLDRPIPANALLDALGSRTFAVWFQVMLFGTLVETGTGMIHAVNERIAGVFSERDRVMPSAVRPVVGVSFLLLAATLAQFGVIDLIAKGYGTITWVFIVIFVIPILTWGIIKVRRA